MADDGQQSESHQPIIKYLNIKNAKLAALFLVMGSVGFHGMLHIRNGDESCKRLLTQGRPERQQSWQPQGCMLHKYNKIQAKKCLSYVSFWGGRNYWAFVGDSRIRALYIHFVNKLRDDPVTKKFHADMHYHDKTGARIDFHWQPYPGEDYIKLVKAWHSKPSAQQPNLIITGSGTWAIKDFNATPAALNLFTTNLSSALPYLEQLKTSTKVIWMLQDPVVEGKLWSARKMITNKQIELYNEAAVELLVKSPLTIWSSSHLVAQSYHDDSEDGLHPGPVAMETDIQILLNLYCNDRMGLVDGTCCRTPEKPAAIQLAAAVVFSLCILVAACLFVVTRLRQQGLPTTVTHMLTHVKETSQFTSRVQSLAKLGLILAYFYLCDRANFFMKENKHYSHAMFFIPLSYVMILGVYLTEIPKQFQSENHGTSKVSQFLHRDQSDEWKGWLQLVILIYHITGASQILPIYMHIRLLVSSYLFLSGYGHFSYFYKKGDYSFYRVCKVMYRMNAQVVMLCFVMNRPYQFYYFVPLVSYWFITVYVTMAIWPHVTAASTKENPLHYLYLLLKLILLGISITVFYISEVLFERVFLSPLIKALFVLSDHTIKEWSFRWQLDRYTTLSGVVFGYLVQIAKNYKLFDDTDSNSSFGKKHLVMLSLSVLGLVGYSSFTFFCKSKVECNNVHSYIVFIPIISYLVLRNTVGWVRVRYSYFFAWFGKISLELFISQYHIWLASDTYGVLVLIPAFPVLNLLVTTFIFVCCSHEISQLISVLDPLCVPSTLGHLVRNVSIFVAVLLALAVSHGMLSF